MVNNVVVELAKLGIDVVIIPTGMSENFGSKTPIEISSRLVHRVQPDDLELVIEPPIRPLTPGKLTAWFTMFESSRLKESALKILNASELVIVPSNWNAATFSAQGLNVPIHVVPLGCDSRYEPMPRGGKFTFAAAGRMAHGGTRKGIEAVIENFEFAFPYQDDVRLNVKIFPDCKLPDTGDSRISVTRAHLTDAQMHRWMASAHCFVSAAKGEGWGLHQHEAMAIGRPVIAPIHGGLAEFMNPHNSYPVKFTHTVADGYYENCGTLITPDGFSMSDQMRAAYEDRQEVERKGWLAHCDVRGLTWANTARQLLSVLEESGAL